jgi:hypothetical protein
VLGEELFLRRSRGNKRLAERRVTVKLDPKAKEWGAEKGFRDWLGGGPEHQVLFEEFSTL